MQDWFDISLSLFFREVFQCSVLICFWRVRHAWHKNLTKRCIEAETRAEVARRLGEAVHSICKGSGTVDLFDNFMKDFVDCSDFWDYFKSTWYPRLGRWTSALQSLPLASQETCAAVEFYHNQLRLRLLNEKDPGVYERADWLVDKLGTKVHSYFWLDEYSGKDDFARYWKDEWMSGLTAWRKSLKISDTDVVMEGKRAKVIDQKDRDTAHVIWNPGSEYAICDCSLAEMGNLCEHVLKIIKFCRDKRSSVPSVSLFQYNKSLIDMLHCPPFDSLIRDHAVSLAIWVQKQLNAQLNLDSRPTTVVTAEQQTIGTATASQDRDDASENLCTSDNVSLFPENGSVFGDEPSGFISGDLIDQVASEDDIFGERTGVETLVMS